MELIYSITSDMSNIDFKNIHYKIFFYIHHMIRIFLYNQFAEFSKYSF